LAQALRRLLNYISGRYGWGLKPVCSARWEWRHVVVALLASRWLFPDLFRPLLSLLSVSGWAFEVWGGGVLHDARNQSPRIASVGSRQVFSACASLARVDTECQPNEQGGLIGWVRLATGHFRQLQTLCSSATAGPFGKGGSGGVSQVLCLGGV
jgi:hypothetical protein